MRLMLAALKDPHAMVMFATDGIVSTRALKGLERVRDVGAGEKAALGDWEMDRLGGGMFLQSGLYVLFKLGGETKNIKTRGVNMARVLLGKHRDKRNFLENHVLPQWRKVFDPNNPDTLPRLVFTLPIYETVGAAVASRSRYRLRGRWYDTERTIDIHEIGVKRALMVYEGTGFHAAFYHSRGAGERKLVADQIAELAALADEPVEAIEAACAEGVALRCRMLVPTLPTENATPQILSGPRAPEWLDYDWGNDVYDTQEIRLAEAA
jgi:hypothetical protein